MQSEEERIRYDRQIRLWGANTQQQISTTCLRSVVAPEVRLATAAPQQHQLATTPSGLVGEVSKNLVLAGIKSIALESSASAAIANCGGAASLITSSDALVREDFENNFYARLSSHGGAEGGVAARHTAMAAMMQDLNPFVSVSTIGGGGADDAIAGGNAVVIEQCSIVALAAHALSVASASAVGAPSVVATGSDANANASNNGVLSVWGALSVGPYSVVLEQTTANSDSSSSSAAAVKAALWSRLLDLYDPRRSRCAALPNPARVVGVVLGLVAEVMALALASGPAVTTDDVLTMAHDLVLGDAADGGWGLALTADVHRLIGEGCGYACEVLRRAGYSFAAAAACRVVASANPCPTVVDASVTGGLVAQRIINAVSSPPSAGGVCAENVYAFASSGAAVEAYVAPWPKLAA